MFEGPSLGAEFVTCTREKTSIQGSLQACRRLIESRLIRVEHEYDLPARSTSTEPRYRAVSPAR